MKKNISVAMAGAMVVTSVLPTFAATTQTEYKLSKEDAGKLTNKIEELVKIKYSVGEKEYLSDGNTKDVANTPVYDIVYKKVGENNAVTNLTIDNAVTNLTIDNSDANKNNINILKSDIAQLSGSKKITLSISDKGHKTDGTKVLRTQDATYTNDELAVLENKLQDTNNRHKAISSAKKDGATLRVTLKSGAIIELKENEKEIDLTKPVDAQGNEVKKAGDDWTDAELDKIINFQEKIGENIPSIPYTINVTDSDESTVDLDDVYDGLLLTTEGEKIKSRIEELLTDTGAGASTSTASVDSKITLSGNVYKFGINLTSKEGKTTTITIQGSDKNNMEELNAALQINNNKIVGTKTSILAGSERYDTAIEVAKEMNPTGKNIVLVNATAIVDGLAAGPLAKATNAPILLTAKDKSEENTLKYISDLYKNSSVPKADRTIYLVGGESVISKNIENQLKTDFGVTVKRLSGIDRHETSLEVAKAISKLDENKDGKADLILDKAYVVGANGEADAMSISPVASGGGKDGKINPIIVNGFTGISKDATEFLKGKDIDIIGSKSAVSQAIEDSLEKEDSSGETIDKDGLVTRIEGKDRHETNAKVISNYYTTFNKVYLAKDSYNGKNNNELVDALAAGPLAARDKSPIVIANNAYSQAQEDVLSAKATTNNSRLVQVGQGVKSSVLANVAAKLGLIK